MTVQIPIYQALKVAEIWRYSADGITSLHRAASGVYKASKKSLAFPDLDMGRFSEFVADAIDNQHKAVKALQAWARRSSKTPQ